MPEITNYGVSRAWEGKWKCQYPDLCGAEWTMKPEDGNNAADQNKPLNIRTVTVGGEQVKVFKMNCPVCHLVTEGPLDALGKIEEATNPRPTTQDGQDNEDNAANKNGDGTPTLPVSAAVPMPAVADTSTVNALPNPAINWAPNASGEGPNPAIFQQVNVTAPVDGVDNPPVVKSYGVKEQKPTEPTESAVVATKADVENPTLPVDESAPSTTPNPNPDTPATPPITDADNKDVPADNPAGNLSGKSSKDGK